MKARLLIGITLVLALTGAAVAAEPIIGTWRLNIAKSKFAANGFKVPREITEVYRELNPGQIELTFMKTETDGSSTLLKVAFPSQGGAARCIQGCPSGYSVVETLISGEWYATEMQDGKQYMTLHKVISKDGKIYYQTLQSSDAKGKPFQNLLVYEKQ